MYDFLDRQDFLDSQAELEVSIYGVLAETELAWLVLLEEPTSPFEKVIKEWLPKSKCRIVDGYGSDISDSIPWRYEAVALIPEWLANEKDLW